MPCYDGRDDYRSRDVQVRDCSYVQNRLDKVTRLLCFVMSNLTLPTVSALTRMPSKDSKDLQQWWKEHQEIDLRRLKAEEAEQLRKKLKKQALSKLTDEERKALGI